MSNWKRILLAAPLLALSLTTPAVEAKDHWKKHSEKEWRRRQAERNYRYSNPYGYQNNGYYNRSVPRGLDRNGNGVIDRYEWRGNQRSWDQYRRTHPDADRYYYYRR